MNKLSKKELFNILGLVVIWRLFLQFIIFIAKNRLLVLPDNAYQFSNPNPWQNNLPEWLQPFANWDSGWYLKIARDGYHYVAGLASNVVFFPLYPELMRIVSWVTGHSQLLAGLLISHLALLATVIYLYKLVKIDFSKQTAWRAILYLLLFPTSFFLVSVYTESLFLLLAILSFYFARQQKWRIAGLTGLLLGLTKAWGVIIIIPLLVEYLEQKKFNLKYIHNDILNLLLIPLGAFFYALFLKIKFGSFMLFASSQGIWHGETAFSLTTVISQYWNNIYLTISDNVPYQTAIFFDFSCLVLGLTLSLLIFFRLRKSYGIYAVIALLIPVATGIMVSMSRYLLIIFPIYILLAHWGKNKLINATIIMFSGGLLAFLLTLFIHNYWIA